MQFLHLDGKHMLSPIPLSRAPSLNRSPYYGARLSPRWSLRWSVFAIGGVSLGLWWLVYLALRSVL